MGRAVCCADPGTAGAQLIFRTTKLDGVWLIEPQKIEDERGNFARTFCEKEFVDHGLDTTVSQCNLSFNRKRGTLRGMHFQKEPYAETKLVRCTRGRMYDVVADLRPESPTHKHWVAFDLSAENRMAVYIPAGCAHGFMTLEDETEVFYQINVPYRADHASGFRWDDPAFNIHWPDGGPKIISPKDKTWPHLEDVCSSLKS